MKNFKPITLAMILSMASLVPAAHAEPECVMEPAAPIELLSLTAPACLVETDGIHPDLIPDEAIDRKTIQAQIEAELSKLKSTEIEYQKLNARVPDYKVASAELKSKIESQLRVYSERLGKIQEKYSQSLSKSYSRIKALKEAAALDYNNGVFHQSVRDEQERALKLIQSISKEANQDYQKAVNDLRNLGHSDADWKSGVIFGQCASAPCVRMLKKDLEEWTNLAEQMNISVDMDRLVHSDVLSSVTRSKIYSPKRPVVTEAILNFAKKQITSPLMPKNEACSIPEIALLGIKKGVDAGVGVAAAVSTIPVFFGEGMVKVGTEVAKLLDTKFTNISLDLDEVDFDQSTASRINQVDEMSEEFARELPPAFFDNEYEDAIRAGRLKTAKDLGRIRSDSKTSSDLNSAERFHKGNYYGAVNAHSDGLNISFEGGGSNPEKGKSNFQMRIHAGLGFNTEAIKNGLPGVEGKIGLVPASYRTAVGNTENGSDFMIGGEIAGYRAFYDAEGKIQSGMNFFVPMPQVEASTRIKGIVFEGKVNTYLFEKIDGGAPLLVTSGRVSIPVAKLGLSRLMLNGQIERFMQDGRQPLNRLSLGVGYTP